MGGSVSREGPPGLDASEGIRLRLKLQFSIPDLHSLQEFAVRQTVPPLRHLKQQDIGQDKGVAYRGELST
jgi:hypothetical protein